MTDQDIDQDDDVQSDETIVLASADDNLKDFAHVEDLYKSWFLDYASYVILDRAVPCVDDGLKPVQRRLLHALWELDDGRFNKAANVIGHTMRYHPHGDMAIGDALVKLGQKELLIETQGNWGNPLTGDRAAAPRYIEARLSKFAKEILFNPQTTNWSISYDGRNKEPVTLPAKFPLLLVQGAEGIAVGLSTRILPHNFCEIIKASISYLNGRKQKIYPDFPTGGIADFSNYNDGAKGGKIRVRALIEKIDQKRLRITELPAGQTTTSLIDSILLANDKGKIKIKRVEDNTAAHVDIVIEISSGISAEQTIEGLFAFTDCEVSISPNCCIIRDERPFFVSISDVLESSVEQTKFLLKSELEIKRQELRDKIHLASLEQVFIEQKIYRKIEGCETWDEVLSTIEKGLRPFKETFIREITTDDVLKLTEIKIKRISKFDSSRAEEGLAKLKKELKEIEYDLKNLIPYVIRFYEGLQERYGKNQKRRTKKAEFDDIKAIDVAVADKKVYVDYKEGFIGTGIKKDHLIGECTDFDEIVGFGSDGTVIMTKVAPKVFLVKDLIHVDLFRRNDERLIYHLIYRDGPKGHVYAKRFSLGGMTRDKSYDLTRGTKGSQVLYFSSNPNGESEIVDLKVKSKKGQANSTLTLDFGQIEIKPRTIKGQLITKDKVEKVTQQMKGKSTLEAQKIYFDRKSGRLTLEETSEFLGEFSGNEHLVAIHNDGTIEVAAFDLNHYFGSSVNKIGQYVEGQVISVVFYEGERKSHYVKRFALDEGLLGKRVEFVPLSKDTKVLIATTKETPLVKVTFKTEKGKTPTPELVRLAEFIDVKGVKALGNRLSKHPVKDVTLL